MRKAVRAVVAGGAALALAVTFTGSAIAANAPTPAQVAAGYMKAPIKINQKVPLKTKPPTGIKVAYMEQGIPTQVMVGKYLAQAATDIGWSVFEVPWNTADPTKINSGLQTAMQQGAQVIVAPGILPSVVSETVKNQLAAAKIPVILGQTCLTGPVTAPFVAGFGLCANEAPIARALAAWVTADSGGKGKILFADTQGVPLLVPFKQRFAAELASMCPGCTLTYQAQTLAQYATGQIPGIMVSALRRDPSIQYLFFDTGQLSTGILRALDAAGLLSTIKVGGRSASADQLQALRDKQEVVWTIQAFGVYGYAALDAALRVVTGSSGITGDAVIPVQLLTTVNIGTAPDPYEVVPADALAQYKKLWRVS
jgi:ribose transport system substrate-binding protein